MPSATKSRLPVARKPSPVQLSLILTLLVTPVGKYAHLGSGSAGFGWAKAETCIVPKGNVRAAFAHPAAQRQFRGHHVMRNRMDRFIDTIEWVAAVFVGIVAADVFVSVLLRYFFSTSIPDSYNFGQLLLGILIFWGIAATSYRGGHITVDLVWANAGPRGQRFIDVFATLVLLFVVTVQTYTLFDKVVRTWDDNIVTVDLNVPYWPFYALAWIGDVSAVLLIAIRTWRLIFHPEDLHASETKAVE
jgi:TRAP-type C4-dicarboxylate transport system permease small subunit